MSRVGHMAADREGVLQQETFQALLTLERRRAERSRKPFVLMLLDSHAVHATGGSAAFAERLASVVSDATRETDLVGWYEKDMILAVIFTEISLEGKNPVTEVLHSKVLKALRENLDHKLAAKLIVTVHLFPETWDKDRGDSVVDIKLYPDLSRKKRYKRKLEIKK